MRSEGDLRTVAEAGGAVAVKLNCDALPRLRSTVDELVDRLFSDRDALRMYVTEQETFRGLALDVADALSGAGRRLDH